MAQIPETPDAPVCCPDCGAQLGWRNARMDATTKIRYCRDCLEVVELIGNRGGGVETFYLRSKATPPAIIRFGQFGRYERVGNGLTYREIR